MYALADSQVPILDDGGGIDRYANSYYKMTLCIVIIIIILFFAFLLKYKGVY
ncbi:MAG: hypothetical protein Terrestrivirus2_176 [Terrestrivirus sp.]|uniref:Uncharacterized protein n=1 Tax=Terrestrivirus sp. TaxID=2487775 RepID=A0A3G4ZLG7_9VIRU|nr:MAG: hypothetical protein Terrestrivirus2_176 [Terrestrivirus sp.]